VRKKASKMKRRGRRSMATVLIMRLLFASKRREKKGRAGGRRGKGGWGRAGMRG